MSAKTESQNKVLDFTRAIEIAESEFGSKGPVIRVLQAIQAEYGFIPPEFLPEMADILEVPLARIFGALTFYSQFYTSPRGKYVVKVCVGTACHVQGSKDILERMKTELQVGAGETTEDMMFTLEPVACIGSCGLAPLCLINTETAASVTPAKMAEKVHAIREREATTVAEE
ncbi:MAG: NAD(P)H-dependent oxidoreductase subunit E [Nitrospirota bacterium]|nr:NAD(P)H-dependent oxidoreductase subunit E [Nitrospirota bacterium]